MPSSQNNIDGTVAVVGVGVVGCFVAYRLAAMGLAVTIPERDGPGSDATGNSVQRAVLAFVAKPWGALN